MSIYRQLRTVATQVKIAQKSGVPCTLLIGAGCSKKAGIPLASEFVEIIRNEHREIYEDAQKEGEVTYASCLKHFPSQQLLKRWMSTYIDGARINWAHVAIAQLMKEGYVDRVLTTNFDPLMVRACALVNEFPAVYDFGISQYFDSADVYDKSIFHLHGQRTGFVILNTDDELEKHAVLIDPVVKDRVDKSIWIVVGYSGSNDPVFKKLAEVSCFDYHLFWIGYKDEEPPPHVWEDLLEGDKNAFYIKGYDPDTFFVRLAQELGCFPPEFISDPSSYMRGVLDALTKYSPYDQGDEVNDIVDILKEYYKGRVTPEEQELNPEQQAWSYLMAAKYDKVIEMAPDDGDPSDEIKRPVAWAHIYQGNARLDRAKASSGAEAADLYREAAEEYEAASRITPNYHFAYYNWGLVLTEQARLASGEEAIGLYQQAAEKYAIASQKKSDSYDVFNEWGLALMEQAGWVSKAEESADLLTQAEEKFDKALQIKDDFHWAHNNWGYTLYKRARLEPDGQAVTLLQEAAGKYEEAVKLKSGNYKAFNNWGLALVYQARQEEGESAGMLYEQAVEKYGKALEIKRDYYPGLSNWGHALKRWAQLESGQKASGLLEQATEKFLAAEALVEGPAAYNLACLSALRGDEEACLKWLQKSLQAGNLPDRDHLMQANDLNGVRDKPWFQEFLTTLDENGADG